MTIRCEMNQILLRTIKNHLKRHIFGEKMYYHPSNDRGNHRGNHRGYYDGNTFFLQEYIFLDDFLRFSIIFDSFHTQ